MPKIPGYRQDLQRETRAPYAVADSTPGKIQSQGLADLGQGLQNLGVGLDKQAAYDLQKKKEAENVAISNFGSSIKGLSDSLAFDASSKASPDGSDLVKNYSDQFDKQAQAELKKIQDPLVQQKAYGKYLEIKNDRLERLRSDSEKMFKENANSTYETQMRFGVSRVTSNPAAFDKELNDYAQTILNSGYTDANKQKAIQLGKEQMATAAINGLINAKDYGGAKAQLTTKFGGIFDADKIQKWFDKIDAEKIKSIDLSVKSIQNEEKNFELAQNQRQNKNFTDLYKQVTQMNQVDPYAPGKGTQVEEMNQKIDNMVQSGELKSLEASHLKRFVNKEESSDSSAVTLDLYNKLASGTNVESVKQEVLNASASKSISPETAQTILGRIDFEQERQGARARAGRTKKQDPLRKEGSDLIAAYFKPKFIGDPATASLQEDEANTKALWFKLLETPKYRNDPVGAARASLKKNIPGYSAPKSPEEDVLKEIKDLDISWKRKEIDTEKYTEKLAEKRKILLDLRAGGK